MPSVETKKNDENYDFNDPENEEYQRQLLRPVEIKEDVKLMEHCQRVSRILHSEAFHRELNKILNQQYDEGATCGGLAGSASEANAAAALQEISNFLHPQARLGCSVFNRGATMPIIPINDIKITDKDMSKPEKLLRCKLASVYRLIDLHGWANGMMLHASVRINRDADEFLTNCHGLMNHEITANNLVKVNLKGEVNNLYGRIDLASWVLHASIHQADPVFKCVVHVRTPAVVAVSCMRSGLMRISEEAVKLGDVPVYEWGSASVNVEPGERLSVEQSELTHAIGDKKCILVRNQGLLARGKTVEEAWNTAGLAVHACETQVRLASSVGSANLMLATEQQSTESEIDDHSVELQFESLMRALDAAGHRTGYLYKHAIVVVDRKRRLHEQQHQQEDGHMADMEDEDEDVEIPPSSTSFATRTESGDEPVKQRQPQTQWLLHTPNDYVREEITENGTRKVVSWRPVSAESRQTSGIVETCTSPNQFAPQGHDKHELKHQQQKVKGKYFRDETSAGHQSRVLRNVDQTSEVDGVPEDDSVGRVVLVGAVSRGIIDKRHRHDPSVYQSCFSPNPFDRVTDDDLKQYKRKVLGLPSDEAETSKQEVSITEPSVTDTNISSPVDKPIIVEPTPKPEEHEEEIIVPSPSQQEMHAEPAAPISTTTPSLTVSTAIRSDTSGADLSHDDTEREGHKSGTGGKKKKKKLKEMFSFRKSKDKSK